LFTNTAPTDTAQCPPSTRQGAGKKKPVRQKFRPEASRKSPPKGGLKMAQNEIKNFTNNTPRFGGQQTMNKKGE